MPLTFPAHQAPLLPLKLWRRDWFDGTALVVGAATPDLAYPLGDWLHRQSHTATGVLLWAIPATLLICVVVRWRAAATIFAHLPDAGRLRLRSYGALASARPALLVTLTSAAVAAGSHVVIDGFTHSDRWGADWLGLDTVIGSMPVRGEFTVARLLQYTGHTFGSAVALLTLATIGRSNMIEHWYGEHIVSAHRRRRPTIKQRAAFWSVVAAAVACGFVMAEGSRPFATILALVIGLLLAGSLPLASDAEDTDPTVTSVRE